MKQAMLSSDDITQLQKIQQQITLLINVSNHKKIVQEEILQNAIYNMLGEALEEMSIIRENFRS